MAFSKRPTVADLLDMKGKRQLSMLRVMTIEEAEAAEKAGIELLSVPPELLTPEFRARVPTAFVFSGVEPGELVTADDHLRAAFQSRKAGADAVYCAASLATIRRLRDEGIAVCGHVGLVPSRRTWTGGFRAVGKTAASALEVYRQTKALEEAGAFSAEIEVVPEAVATEISKRTSMQMISMGAGSGCDAQYLFAEDVLGSHSGHFPRHSKTYRNFVAEYERLQQERIAAFSEFRADVESGGYPEARHIVPIADEELATFLAELPTEGS
jgi:3-methyl-2-oxobutanoate hydroxymethyltransferase